MSVRDRISVPEQAPPEPTRSVRTGLTAGNAPTQSVRQRAQAAADAEERLTPPDNKRFAGLADSGVQAPQHVPSVREKVEREAREIRESATPISETSSEAQRRSGEFWLAYETAQIVKQRQREADEERARQDRVARQRADQEEAVRCQQEDARMLAINLAFDQVNATPQERQKILALPAAKNAIPEKLVSMLWTLRDCMPSVKPVWADVL